MSSFKKMLGMILACVAAFYLFTASTALAVLPVAQNSFDYVAFLQANPVGTLATVDGEQPKTRMFQFLWADDGKFYFCTSNEKDVFRQMQANNLISFCVFSPAQGMVLNLDGPVTFVEDLALKTRALDENPSIKQIYQNPDNPIFELFYLEPAAISTFDFGQGKTIIR